MSATTSAASSPPPGHLAYRDTSPPTDTESDSSDNSGDEIEQSLASIPLRGRGADMQRRASLGRKRRSTTSRAVIKRRVVSNSSILGMTEDMSTLQTSPTAADEVDSCLSDDLTDYKVHPVYPAHDLHCAKKRRPYDSKTARYVAGPSKRANVQAPRYHRAFKKRPLTLDMARAVKRRGPDLSAWDASETPTDADEMLKEMAARAGYKLLPLSPRSHAAAVDKLDASKSGPSTSSDFVDDVLLASAPSDDDESELELPDTPTHSPRKKFKTTPAPTPRRNMKSAAKGKGRAKPLSKGKGRAEPIVVAEASAPALEPSPVSKLEIINPVLKRAARKGKARADTLSSVRLTHGASARQRYAPAVPVAASHAAPRGVKQLPRERRYMFTLAQRPAGRQIKRPRLVFARRRVALRRPTRLRFGSKAQTRCDKSEVPLDTAGNGYWAAAKAHLVISRTRRGLYRRYQERISAPPSGAVASGVARPSTTASTSSAGVSQHGSGDVTFADGNDDDDLVDELLHEPGTDRLVGKKRAGASTSRSDGDARRDVRNRARHAEEFDNYHVARRAYKAVLAEHRRDPDARRQAQAMRHLQAVAADREARYEQNRVDAELRCLEAEEAQDEDDDVADETVDVDVDEEAAVETLRSETVVDEADMEADLNEEPAAEELDVEVASSEEDTVANAVDESMAEPTPEATVSEHSIDDGSSPDDAASVADDAEDVAAILAAAAEPLSPPPRYEYPFEPIIRPVPRQLRPAPRVRRNAPAAEPPRYVRELYNRRSPSPPPPYNAQTDRETVLAPVFLPEPAVTAPVLPLGPPAPLRRHRDPSPAPSETSDDLHAPGTWPTRRRRAPLPPPTSHVYDVEMGQVEDEIAQPPAGTFSAIRRWLGF